MKTKIFIGVLVVAFLLSFSVVVKDAKADAILYPWIVKNKGTVSTLISVVNTAGDPSADFDYQLHYQYWAKEWTGPGSQLGLCEHLSFKRPTSKDDIVTFDAAGFINDGKPLFNDSTPYGGQSFSLPTRRPVEPVERGFLIVDNNTPALVAKGVNLDGTLYGEAMVLEIAGGAAWGYIAYNSDDGVAGNQTDPVCFEDGLDSLGEVIGTTEMTQTVLLPPDVGIARFFMTPIDKSVVCNQRKGDITSSVQLVYRSNGVTYGGIYDNNENPIDFGKVKYIKCTSADNLEELMTDDAYAYFRNTGGQGWSYIKVYGNDMVIGKLEFTTTGVTIDGTAIPGTLNNFVWLRDAENEPTIGGTSILDNVVPTE